ncbi:MAG: HDIG domain-containing metalloprotein [Acidobacteriota bacterium]
MIKIKKEEILNYPNKLKEKKTKSKFLFYLKIILFISLISFFLTFTIIPKRTTALPVLKKGEIAEFDVVCPVDITIEDRISTENKKREAYNSVPPVYNLDKNVFANLKKNVNELFLRCREELNKKEKLNKNQMLEEIKQKCISIYNFDIPKESITFLIKNNFNENIESLLLNMLEELYSKGILLNKISNDIKNNEFIIIESDGKEKTLKLDDTYDILEAKNTINRKILSMGLSSEEKSSISEMVNSFLYPNLSYNSLATLYKKEKAMSEVSSVLLSIKKGKILIRKGDEVKEESINFINSINEKIENTSNWFYNFSGNFLLIFLFTGIMIRALSLAEFPSLTKINAILFFMTQFFVNLVLLKFFLSISLVLEGRYEIFFLRYSDAFKYAFPYSLGTIVTAFLSNFFMGFIFSLFLSIFAGILLKADFWIVIFSFLSSFAALLGIEHYGRRRRSSVIKTCFILILPINILLIIILHIIEGSFYFNQKLLSEITICLFNVTFVSIFASFLLPLMEGAFGIISEIKLLELSDSDLPIFRRLAIQAPGTYHHSLMVASLSEQAAKSINLNPLLLKTVALYHDVGKIEMPELFIENQLNVFNIHEKISPEKSVSVIVGHVEKGDEILKKLRIMPKLREMIKQHHGTSLVRYFFHKAKESQNTDDLKVLENNFRYPGPKPATKESVILMLADSVEAASKSLKNPTPEIIENIINEIFNKIIEDGQLEECEITLKELNQIASSFYNSLVNLYHQRIQYPDFKFHLKETKNKK